MNWGFFIVALLALVVAAKSGVTETTSPPQRALPHHTTCPVPLPDDFWDAPGAEVFEASEKWAWNERICLGQPADVRYAPGGKGAVETCRPTEIEDDGETVPFHRNLRPAFLELILSHEPWASAPRHPLVAIVCALVDETIKLDDHDIPSTFLFHQGKINGGVHLVGSRFQRTLGFNGSTITGMLQADSVEIGGYLLLRGGGTFADIVLRSAKIGGNAGFDSSTVTGTLTADDMEVGDNLFLRGGGSFRAINLIGAHIGGDVQLAGSTFSGVINATGAKIAGELHLSSTKRGLPTWVEGSGLLLRNASADALQARQDDWRIEYTWPVEDALLFADAWSDKDHKSDYLPTDLTGFSYNRFGGVWAGSGQGMADASADWLIHWLTGQDNHGSHYDPQPYEQLAKVLKNAGATEKAKAIRFGKFLHKIAHDPEMSWVDQVWMTAQRWVVGFGIYPFLALYWFFGLVGLGAILAFFSLNPAIRRFPYPLWYSLENALPLVEMNRAFEEADHGTRRLNSFFHLQKILGFFLATVLVGALTLLSR